MDEDNEASIDAEIEKCFVGKLSEGVGLNAGLDVSGINVYYVRGGAQFSIIIGGISR